MAITLSALNSEWVLNVNSREQASHIKFNMGNADQRNEQKILSRIIQEYAEMWADVILDKNLVKSHLEITRDINYLDGLIARRHAQKLNTDSYLKIANQLARLEKIIREKLGSSTA